MAKLHHVGTNDAVPDQPGKPRRSLLRFSVRTLAILLTLVCCYSACWGPTKNRGVEDVKQPFAEDGPDPRLTQDARAVAPLLISTDEVHLRSPIPVMSRCYYFWCFGYVAKLPYEREIDWPVDARSGAT